jgi:hypothetical protein
MAPVEGQAAQKAGAEGERVELRAGGGIADLDPAELAGAGVQHPQLAAIEARGVRHGQPAEDDLAGRHVDDDAAVGAPVAPAVDGVRL